MRWIELRADDCRDQARDVRRRAITMSAAPASTKATAKIKRNMPFAPVRGNVAAAATVVVVVAAAAVTVDACVVGVVATVVGGAAPCAESARN